MFDLAQKLALLLESLSKLELSWVTSLEHGVVEQLGSAGELAILGPADPPIGPNAKNSIVVYLHSAIIKLDWRTGGIHLATILLSS